MKTAHIRFYEELNDFLPPPQRKQRFDIHFNGTPSIKDVIESQGVPHTEIDLILVNGTSVRFNYKLKNEDDVSVYPLFESFDISSLQRLRAKPLRHPKFVLDVHLGALAKYMRMLGFDTKYQNDFLDEQIIEISLKEKRTALTRDVGILKQKKLTHGYYVRNTKPVKQIEEIIIRFDLKNEINEFSRCVRCNTILSSIEKEKVINEIPPKVRIAQSEFFYCSVCDKIYWKGTHYEKMKVMIEKMKAL
ncbi:MAG: Mut7-C ubiquitin/RNAse domain-containing protein [Ignavibacteriales bacterium]|nr:Mut7-C ubiquitin/RNAse domain-containing protein [Ignavibacteriales bacterium]